MFYPLKVYNQLELSRFSYFINLKQFSYAKPTIYEWTGWDERTTVPLYCLLSFFLLNFKNMKPFYQLAIFGTICVIYLLIIYLYKVGIYSSSNAIYPKMHGLLRNTKLGLKNLCKFAIYGYHTWSSSKKYFSADPFPFQTTCCQLKIFNFMT